jgi:hypothetical protein
MLTPTDAPIDDLADLSSSEWDNLREWCVLPAKDYTAPTDPVY